MHLPKDVERLSIGNRVRETRRMSLGDGSLAGNLAYTGRHPDPLEKLALGTTDRYNELSLLVSMTLREGNCSLAINEAGEVCRFFYRNPSASLVHGFKKSPRSCDRGRW
jgi:hypothetical protein